MICTMDTVGCPGCGQIMGRVTDGGVRFVCAGCAGQLVGLAPFEHRYPDRGRQLWVAAAGGAAAGRCPFCTRDLLRPAAVEAPPGLAVCRLCEQVWVPPEAESWLDARTAGGVSAEPVRPTHADTCPGCGAPWAPDAGGCCRYCKEQLSNAAATTVIIEAPPPVRAGGLLGSLLGGLERDW
jgi:hypothetical protein